MRAELQAVLKSARNLPPEELPELIGELAQVTAAVKARLYSQPAPAEADDLLDVDAAARMLGQSPSWLYHHHHELPFSRRLPGSRNLLFSRLGIEKYLRLKVA
jgi:hypothetical protein